MSPYHSVQMIIQVFDVCQEVKPNIEYPSSNLTLCISVISVQEEMFTHQGSTSSFLVEGEVAARVWRLMQGVVHHDGLEKERLHFQRKKSSPASDISDKKVKEPFYFLSRASYNFFCRKKNWPVGFLLESENGFKIEPDQKKMNAAVITIFYFILHYSGLHFHIFILFLQNGKIIKRSATGG